MGPLVPAFILHSRIEPGGAFERRQRGLCRRPIVAEGDCGRPAVNPKPASVLEQFYKRPQCSRITPCAEIERRDDRLVARLFQAMNEGRNFLRSIGGRGFGQDRTAKASGNGFEPGDHLAALFLREH